MTDRTFRVQPEDETAHVPMPAATRRVECDALPGSGLPLGVLAPGTMICEGYVIERTIHPHETERPGLFLCQGPEGRVVVKVAATRYPPKMELWQKLVFLRHPHVLRTYRTLEQQDYFFEVQEYCPGGPLDARVPKPGTGNTPPTVEWITGIFIPQMLQALKYLHGQEIIHRDFKPGNIYLKTDGTADTLVLGDFDISSVLEDTRTSRDTQRAAGTWLYTPPEAFPRFVDDHASGRRGRVSRSCDYYSLGVTIIELLLGTTSLHLCQLPDLFDFYLQGGRIEIPKGIPGHLAILLRGLLIRNRRTRWGADEVERWLADDNTDGDLQRITDDDFFELAHASRPYRMNDRTAVDLPGLAEMMFCEREVATEDLITADILLNWVGALNPTVAREIRRDRDSLYPTPELVLHRAIMHCDPTRPFVFEDGTEVHSAQEWMTYILRVIADGLAYPEVIYSPAMLYQLVAWLQLKGNPEPQLAEAIAALISTPVDMRFEELQYLLLPEKPFDIMPGIVAQTPKDLVRLTYGKPEDWHGKRPVTYEMSYQRWFDGALSVWMRQRGLGELAKQCDELQAQMADEPAAAFEKVLRLLDPELPPVEVVLDCPDAAVPRSVPFRKERTFTVRYFARSCGVPFGALHLQGRCPGVRLHQHTINQRNGELAITIDGKQDVQALKVYVAKVAMDSGIAVLVDSPFIFRFRIQLSNWMAVKRIAIGASIGAVILGLPRIIMSIFGASRPITLDGRALDQVWKETNNGHFPLVLFAIGLVIFLVCLYAGLRIWFAAYRQSET